jgi:hypothetical protein
MNIPEGCTSKAGVHRNTPLLRVFQCLLLFFLERRKISTSIKKGNT